MEENTVQLFETTDDHFKYFKKRVKVYLKKYNLLNWSVYFEHRKFIDENDAYPFAQVYYDTVNKSAEFELNVIHVDKKPDLCDILRIS